MRVRRERDRNKWGKRGGKNSFETGDFLIRKYLNKRFFSEKKNKRRNKDKLMTKCTLIVKRKKKRNGLFFRLPKYERKG